MFQAIPSDAIAFIRARPSVAGDVVSVPKPRRRGRTRVKLRPSDIREKGVQGMLRWLQRDFPAAHAALAAKRPELLRAAVAGLGQVEAPAAPTVGQKIADFVMPLLQVYQQRQILRLQLARAKAGQPPLDVESLSAPATRIELDAGAKTRQMVAVLVGIFGLGAVAYFVTRSRR